MIERVVGREQRDGQLCRVAAPDRNWNMDQIIAEFLGTAILILLGNGVVANVVLDGTKGHNAGWIVITAGWGFAVYTAVLCVGHVSGGHLNPAVTIGLAIAGKFDWELAPGFIIAQMAGAAVGTTLVYVLYQRHYAITADPNAKLATFCTGPNLRAIPINFLSEAIATFVLIYAALMMADASFTFDAEGASREVKVGLGSIGAVRVGLIVFSIGLSLGGTTGYAINPARDLAPRVVHALLPIPGKRDSDWSYSWVPVLGPIAGAVLAASLFLAQG
jgi:glycerol uptake facilitator protein